MLAICSLLPPALVLNPTTPPTRHAALPRPAAHSVNALLTKPGKPRLGKLEIKPGQRYRDAPPSTKYYDGRTPESKDAFKGLIKDAGKRKIVVISGASSGLGLFCVEAMSKEDYFIVAAVRDPEKMHEAARKAGIAPTDYRATELQLASLDSVKDFCTDLRKALGGRGLDRLVCNAAVYLPTDPKPRFTDDGYEMSLGVNHLGHFLMLQLLLPPLKKAKEARVCIVGSVTGNRNTVAGSLVKPIADVGDLRGLKLGPGQVMADGAKLFDGAKAYKDAKALNMMTVLEAHRRLHESTGIVFNSMYPGCIANTQLFREKREWFRYFFFPTLMKVIGSYVSQVEAGERLAQVVEAEETARSGVYWSWNGNGQYLGVGNAGGSGGAIFENQFAGMVLDEHLGELSWDYSMQQIEPWLK